MAEDLRDEKTDEEQQKANAMFLRMQARMAKKQAARAKKKGSKSSSKKGNAFLDRVDQIRKGTAEERPPPESDSAEPSTAAAESSPDKAAADEEEDSKSAPKADDDSGGGDSGSAASESKPKKKKMTVAERMAARMAARASKKGDKKSGGSGGGAKKKAKKKAAKKTDPLKNTAALKTRNEPLRDYRVGIPTLLRDKERFEPDMVPGEKVYFQSKDDKMYAPGSLDSLKGEFWKINKLVSEANFTSDPDNPVYIRTKPPMVRAEGFFKILREKDFEVELTLELARAMRDLLTPEIKKIRMSQKYRKKAESAMSRIGKNIDEVGSNITGEGPKASSGGGGGGSSSSAAATPKSKPKKPKLKKADSAHGRSKTVTKKKLSSSATTMDVLAGSSDSKKKPKGTAVFHKRAGTESEMEVSAPTLTRAKTGKSKGNSEQSGSKKKMTKRGSMRDTSRSTAVGSAKKKRHSASVRSTSGSSSSVTAGSSGGYDSSDGGSSTKKRKARKGVAMPEGPPKTWSVDEVQQWLEHISTRKPAKFAKERQVPIVDFFVEYSNQFLIHKIDGKSLMKQTSLTLANDLLIKSNYRRFLLAFITELKKQAASGSGTADDSTRSSARSGHAPRRKSMGSTSMRIHASAAVTSPLDEDGGRLSVPTSPVEMVTAPAPSSTKSRKLKKRKTATLTTGLMASVFDDREKSASAALGISSSVELDELAAERKKLEDERRKIAEERAKMEEQKKRQAEMLEDPTLGGSGTVGGSEESEELKKAREELEAERARMAKEMEELEREKLRQEREKIEEERRELERARQEAEKLRREQEELAEMRRKMAEERAAANAKYEAEALDRERQRLAAEREKIEQTRAELVQRRKSVTPADTEAVANPMSAELEELRKERQRMEDEFAAQRKRDEEERERQKQEQLAAIEREKAEMEAERQRVEAEMAAEKERAERERRLAKAALDKEREKIAALQAQRKADEEQRRLVEASSTPPSRRIVRRHVTRRGTGESETTEYTSTESASVASPVPVSVTSPSSDDDLEAVAVSRSVSKSTESRDYGMSEEEKVREDPKERRRRLKAMERAERMARESGKPLDSSVPAEFEVGSRVSVTAQRAYDVTFECVLQCKSDASKANLDVHRLGEYLQPLFKAGEIVGVSARVRRSRDVPTAIKLKFALHLTVDSSKEEHPNDATLWWQDSMFSKKAQGSLTEALQMEEQVSIASWGSSYSRTSA